MRRFRVSINIKQILVKERGNFSKGGRNMSWGEDCMEVRDVPNVNTYLCC